MGSSFSATGAGINALLPWKPEPASPESCCTTNTSQQRKLFEHVITIISGASSPIRSQLTASGRLGMSLWRLRGGCCTGALWVTRGCFQEDFRKYKSSYKVKSHFRLAGTNKQSCLVTTLGGGKQEPYPDSTRQKQSAL